MVLKSPFENAFWAQLQSEDERFQGPLHETANPWRLCRVWGSELTGVLSIAEHLRETWNPKSLSNGQPLQTITPKTTTVKGSYMDAK